LIYDWRNIDTIWWGYSDTEGNLVKVFSRRLNFYSILEAEVWVMFFVLRMVEEAARRLFQNLVAWRLLK